MRARQCVHLPRLAVWSLDLTAVVAIGVALLSCFFVIHKIHSRILCLKDSPQSDALRVMSRALHNTFLLVSLSNSCCTALSQRTLLQPSTCCVDDQRPHGWNVMTASAAREETQQDGGRRQRTEPEARGRRRVNECSVDVCWHKSAAAFHFQSS